MVRVAGWERFGWLRHGFSTRAGGVSTVYGEGTLNLGWTKEDDPAAGGGESAAVCAWCWWMGMVVRWLGCGRFIGFGAGGGGGGWGAGGEACRRRKGRRCWEGDGLMTDVPGVLLGMGTADCVPVLVVDVEKRVVAAFHAGWRGTVAGIVEQGVAKMGREYGSRVEDLVAAVGPSIGSLLLLGGAGGAGGVWGAVWVCGRSFFGGQDGGEVRIWICGRRIGGSCWRLGLGRSGSLWWGSVRLVRGMQSGALRYFSHRGEKGLAGRMMNVVGVVG